MLHAGTKVSNAGTGNDLSRSIGWGGGYMEEPLEDWLQAIQVLVHVTMVGFGKGHAT